MKICSKCKVEKDLLNFSKNQYKCKCCNKQYNLDNKQKQNEYKKQYYLDNKDKAKQYQLKNKEKVKKYQLDNKEKIAQQRKQYYLDNKEKMNENRMKWFQENKIEIYESIKKRKQTDSLFKLRCSISSLICGQLKKQGYKKNTKTANILGCNFETFKAHLEKQFTKGMNWSNQGEWHLDHIYPVSLAKDETHLIELNHYTNFQPLWEKDNKSKGNKIQEKQLFLI